MTGRLLLVRHGRIRANRRGLWHGSTDSPLTWTGRRQAKAVARRMQRRDPSPTTIVASPLMRCQATATAIGSALELEVLTHDGLREYAIGEWEGMPFHELASTHDFVNRATQDPHFAPPGGESLFAVQQRVTGALHEIVASHANTGDVVVVSHGAAMAVAISTLIEGDHRHWMEYLVGNCSLTELILTPTPYVDLFNDMSHL